ncbi:MAG TPA: DUF192 domain-containing protein [Phycisphaerae bacterium]|nr:DUF192 domain-containing protein [Phycisphaerae bacterium]
MFRKPANTIVLLCLVLPAGCRDGRQPATVTIGGHTWTVEIAMTAAERYNGLSERPRLPQRTGMLFIYPRPHVMTFCMRQCLIPLDIAFIDSNMTVIKIHTMRVEPYGAEQMSYSSLLPAQFALEVNAGELAEAGVKEGDTVAFSSGVPDPAKAEPPG